MTRFVLVVETSGRVAETRSRKAKVDCIAECLRRLEPEELAPAVAFLSGAPRQGKIGLGYRTLREVSAQPVSEPVLAILQVDAALSEIKERQGPGSKASRQQVLRELLARATAAEQRFLGRFLVGELRQGALEGVVLEGIARAADVARPLVRRAAMLSGDMGAVAAAALTAGSAGLGRFSLELFRPVQPMLAQTAGDLDEALRKLDHAFLEWKLDGARIQVHRDGDRIAVYTRRLNDVTTAVPEIVEAVRRLPAERLVLDGETIAMDADGRPRPFQVTMRRFGRRLDVDRLRAQIPIVPFFFDVLHLDGQDLIDLGAGQRIGLVSEVLPPELVVPRLEIHGADASAAADAFLASALERGHEGIMAKSSDAVYEAGRRGGGWLKVKPSHTLDLVVLAAEWGSGRRQGWLSNLHLGARDPGGDGFVMLGKTFKGLTDEMLAWQTARLQELEVSRDQHVVWVRPELVVEVAFDGVQGSPHYPAGMALRFARVKRYRGDKAADQADTVAAVRRIHRGRRMA